MRNLLKLNNRENQRGVAAVEFALVLPILVLLLVGIVEFSMLLYNQQVITNASREGARAASNPLPELNNGEIKEIVENYCEDRLISFGDQSEALTVYINDIQITEANASDNANNNVSEVTVTTKFEYSFLVPGLFNIGPLYEISSSTVMKNL